MGKQFSSDRLLLSSTEEQGLLSIKTGLINREDPARAAEYSGHHVCSSTQVGSIS